MESAAHTGLTLVVGPANSGKMGLVLEWWRERLSQRPVIVVPTAPDAREVSFEMTRRTGAVIGQSTALTFDGLVRLLVDQPPHYATELERDLILSQVLGDTAVDALGPVAQFPGTVGALAALFRQLGESGRAPEEVDRVLARWAAVEPAEASLAADIRRLALAFEQACAERALVDRPAAVRDAVRSAEVWTRPVALYGFTSFTLGQRTLIGELSRRAEVLLTFTHDRARTVNLSTPAEMAGWEAMASEIVEVAPSTRAYESAAIAYLETFFMGEEPRPEPPPPAVEEGTGVRFLLSSGQRVEAESAAEQISKLIREGCRPGEIAVVVRHVRQWSGLLGHVFDSCGIPHQIDDRLVVAETGIGHAFLSAVRGVAFDDPQAILAYLRSPYSEVSLEDVADLETRYRRAAAKGARVFAGIARGMGLAPIERLWDVAGDCTDRPGVCARSFNPGKAEALLLDMLAAAARDSISGSRELEEDARAFAAVRRALATLARHALAGDGPFSSGAGRLNDANVTVGLDPQRALRALAGTAVGGSRTQTVGAVQVLSVQRARARRFEVVLVLGLVEGEFPGRSDAASLLNFAQRARLDALGGGLFSPPSDQEAALFVSAVSRASRLLFLSARDAEDDGGEAVPSRFWESAKQLLGVGEKDHIRRSLADQVFTLEAAPSPSHYLRACASRGISPHPWAATEGFGLTPRPWGRPPAGLSSRSVLAELAAAESFSPSALEAYVKCPFAWFVERVIGMEDVDFELDGRTIGQLLHSALSAVYRRLLSAGLLPLQPASLPSAQSMASAAIDGLVESDECPGTTAERRLAAWRLKRMARNLFEMEASAGTALVLSETEMWVGGRRGVDIGGLRVRGRIDRVDAAPGGRGVFVFDYKSGSAPAPSALGTGEGLQLPLYLLALPAERPGTQVLGGAYLSLNEKKRCGVVEAGSEEVLGSAVEGYRVLDREQLGDLFRSTREVAVEAAAGMRAGVIAPRRDRSCPPWCRLGPACRARRGGYKP